MNIYYRMALLLRARLSRHRLDQWIGQQLCLGSVPPHLGVSARVDLVFEYMEYLVYSRHA